MSSQQKKFIHILAPPLPLGSRSSEMLRAVSQAVVLSKLPKLNSKLTIFTHAFFCQSTLGTGPVEPSQTPVLELTVETAAKSLSTPP